MLPFNTFIIKLMAINTSNKIIIGGRKLSNSVAIAF